MINLPMKKFAELLSLEISRGLPGTEVQWQMASSDRLIRNFPRIPGPDAKAAAVLILLYPVMNKINTVLMQRPEYEGVHGGQISFPGGKAEKTDQTPADTAIRETCEETGITKDEISVINTLTPLFIPVSNILVTPVVAWTSVKPVFRHHPEEVAFLFDTELSRLTDSSIIKNSPMVIRGEEIDVKYYSYDGKKIWGATAMILHELMEIIVRGSIPLTIE